MDLLMKLLQDISLTGALLTWTAFLVGLATGILVVSRAFRRRDKIFGQHILVLQNEINNVDAEVDKLWSKTFPQNYRRVSASTTHAHSADKNTLTEVDLRNAKKILESLAENLRTIAHNVEPRSKPKMNAPVYQQHTHSYESHEIRIHRSSAQRQNLQENYEVHVESNPPDAPDDMVHLYNLAVTDAVARERFREHFCPIRIGTINAVERRQNPTIKAEIRETTDGDFLALPLGSNVFAVFPRLGLTIEAVSFGAGAVGEVFDRTKGHDPKLFYSNSRVKEPAIFELEGEHWLLRKPGELELGFGEP